MPLPTGTLHCSVFPLLPDGCSGTRADPRSGVPGERAPSAVPILHAGSFAQRPALIHLAVSAVPGPSKRLLLKGERRS